MAKYCIFLMIILFLSITSLYSQQYKWKTLTNSPTASWRFNDCSFINPSTGWICDNSSGNVHKTTDGGMSWFIVGSAAASSCRSIVFVDSLNGWIGEYNTNTRLFKTTDGGVTWQIVNLPPPVTTGICGFSVVNRAVVYGCGRYFTPARVIKTTNGGSTWQNIDMGAYCTGLVDCKFFTEDSGIAVGRTANPVRGIILSTADGGSSWDTVYTTVNSGEWCWKISFPYANTGYVSVEQGTSYIKTTDRGMTWTEKPYTPLSNYGAQGIGFMDNMRGWIGGSTHSYETTDGGANWHVLDTAGAGSITALNRFRFFGDTLGYAVGKRVYKYSKNVITSIEPNRNFNVNNFKIYQNYPNPFNPKTKIKFELAEGTNVRITIHDILGKEVATIIEGDYLSAGKHEIEWDAAKFPSGVYYYTIYNHDIGYTKSMLLVK